MKSLYVHFPFCEAKCHYCDFYSLGQTRTREGDPQKFETALAHESTRQAHHLDEKLDTIFFGGGTPSMTSAKAMSLALKPLELEKRLTPETEWTMEANPSSIHQTSFRDYRALGVNRVSMGVQAFRDDHLKILGRVHNSTHALKSLETVFESGFTNVSVDLLCGIPEQTEEDLEKALSTFIQFPITHLSCYLLTLPPHHKMYPQLPNEDTQLSHLLLIDKWMKSHGFEHYEISNFARPGKRARHNLNYWQGKSYLGLGPSAHSFDAQKSVRWKNISSLHKYASQLIDGNSVIEWEEELNEDQIKLEQWMLALRLDDGFPSFWLLTDLQKSRVSTFESQLLVENHPEKENYKRLTAKGFALSDMIIQSLASS